MRRVLETCHSNSNKKPSAKTDVKNSQGVNNNNNHNNNNSNNNNNKVNNTDDLILPGRRLLVLIKKKKDSFGRFYSFKGP